MLNSYWRVLLKYFPDLFCLLVSLGFSAWSSTFLCQPLQSQTLLVSTVGSDRPHLRYRALLWQSILELHSPQGTWQPSLQPRYKAHQSYMHPAEHSESVRKKKEQSRKIAVLLWMTRWFLRISHMVVFETKTPRSSLRWHMTNALCYLRSHTVVQ